MRVRILHKPGGKDFEGVDTSRFVVGQVYEVGPRLGDLLIVSRFAEPEIPSHESHYRAVKVRWFGSISSPWTPVTAARSRRRSCETCSQGPSFSDATRQPAFAHWEPLSDGPDFPGVRGKVGAVSTSLASTGASS